MGGPSGGNVMSGMEGQQVAGCQDLDFFFFCKGKGEVSVMGGVII